MEISGRILREVEFRDRLRGYDTDEVDEFLEKIAVGVDELHAALAKARADLAESSAHPAAPPPEEAFPDDAIRRTLVLAQRTADLAIKEAEEEAHRTLEEAQERAEALIGRAEDEARRARGAAEAALQARVEELTNRRDHLDREVSALAGLLGRERERLGEALSSALQFVNDTLAVSDELREKAASSSPPPQVAGPADDVTAVPGAEAEQSDANDEADEVPEAQLGAPEVPMAANDTGRLPRFDFTEDEDVDLDDDTEPPAPISDVIVNGSSTRSSVETRSNGAALVDDEEELWERWAKSSPLEAGDLPSTDDPFGPDRRGRTTS